MSQPAQCPHVTDRTVRLHRHRRPGQLRPGTQRLRAGPDRARLRDIAQSRADQLHRRGDQHDLAGQRRLGAGPASAQHPVEQRGLDPAGAGAGGRPGARSAGAPGQRHARAAAPAARSGDPGGRRTADAATAPACRAVRPAEHVSLRHGRRSAGRPLQHRRSARGIPFLPPAMDAVGGPLDAAHRVRDQHAGTHHLAEPARRTALADDRDGIVLHIAGAAGRALGRAPRAAHRTAAHAPARLRTAGADRHGSAAAGDPAARFRYTTDRFRSGY